MSETIAFRMRIDPARAAEYHRRHDEIWPELVEALREAGVIDYRIFVDEENGDLFAALTRSAEHSMDSLPATPVMQRWWAMMADLMPPGPDGPPWSRPLKAMFHLGASRDSRAEGHQEAAP